MSKNGVWLRTFARSAISISRIFSGVANRPSTATWASIRSCAAAAWAPLSGYLCRRCEVVSGVPSGATSW